MSEDGFHVHGAHEHALEHEAHQGPGLAQYIAIFTAILATCGAIISYQGGATQNTAMLLKNEAVLKKAQASDQWSFYQAKSQKGHMMELAADLSAGEKAEAYRKQLARYEAEKAAIKKQAEALERSSEKANMESEHVMHPHHRLAQAMTFIQIAISLASVSALTHKKWLFGAGGIAAAVGLALWVVALAS